MSLSQFLTPNGLKGLLSVQQANFPDTQLLFNKWVTHEASGIPSYAAVRFLENGTISESFHLFPAQLDPAMYFSDIRSQVEEGGSDFGEHGNGSTTTCMFGDWHLNGNFSMEDSPVETDTIGTGPNATSSEEIEYVTETVYVTYITSFVSDGVEIETLVEAADLVTVPAPIVNSSRYHIPMSYERSDHKYEGGLEPVTIQCRYNKDCPADHRCASYEHFTDMQAYCYKV